jgi:hypothetical protein
VAAVAEDQKETEVVDILEATPNQEVVFPEEVEVHLAEVEVLQVEVVSKAVVFQEENQALVEIAIVETVNQAEAVVEIAEEVVNKLFAELIRLKNGN